ncbi:M48 family metallopeptidase [Ramlibacter sp. AN1133]|uniref:M48 family metallopeptidase n=1 Tax=Ramlibacter sp. AN1133 TaxID=3133429 RepID=UPI0030C25706
MQHADFVHLVRMSEHASAQDAAAYRRGLAAFAGLGYAWVLGCFVLAGGLLGLIAHSALQGHFRAVYAVPLVAAAGLLWSCARALWFHLAAPAGIRLRPQDAPALFEALERIRRKVKGPPIHEVMLTGELNASIAQRPRWGVFGGARNHLAIGLPLLMALDRQRLLAVLAHEYGHLRRDHGRFGAWIYRTRASWSRLYESMEGESGPVAALTHGFLAWYFPRFVARTFALARQDEYEADRIAARLVGSEVAAAALTEIALKADWLQQHFWPSHWAQAVDQELPVGPYARMRKLLALPLPDAFARRSLRQALRRLSGFDDTHPVLRDRLDGLGVAPKLPAWSGRAALELLGRKAHRWIAHFDHQWRGENAIAWKQYHAALARIRGRIEHLRGRGEKNADEWTELGDLERRLQVDAPARPYYDRALALAPHHGQALQGLYACLPAEHVQQRMACLERLHEASPQHRWWAAQTAIAALEEDPAHDGEALAWWRARLQHAEAAEARAWSELTQQPVLARTSPSDLNEFERWELESELARWPDVRCAWLLRKEVREFPARRCYLLVVDVPRLDAQQAIALCAALEPGLWLPGPVLLLWSGQSPELGEVRGKGRPLYDARVAV